MFENSYHTKAECMNGDLNLLTFYFIAQVLVTIAFTGIPFVLFKLNKGTKNFVAKPLYVAFALLLGSAAITRFLSIASIWYTPYWLLTTFDFITGLIGLYALYILWLAVHRHKRLPSYKELCIRYENVQKEISMARQELKNTKEKLTEVVQISTQLKKIV